MSNQMLKFDSELERRAAKMLADDGYTIQAQPDLANLPFDLEGYRPDFVAVRGDEKLVVEVKGSGLRMPIDRYQRIAAVVSSHPGWRFVLVTPDDTQAAQASGGNLRVIGWDEMRSRIVAAETLMRSGQHDAALLLLWTAFEAAMRRQAQAMHLPVERLPPTVLLKHLYSHGEFSMEQYDRAQRYLKLRNQAVHGYTVDNLDQLNHDFSTLLQEVLAEWLSEAYNSADVIDPSGAD